MYKTFFSLTRNPFELTPDPTCFVPTRRHNEALAALYYGIRSHKGLVVLTGEVGTGKTLVLRCLLRLLKESRDVAYAYLFNSRLTETEFLHYLMSDFGFPASSKNKSELLLELRHFLVSRGSKKQTTVLIIDEAHHLSEDLLEEIRLLSNLERTDDKLLQIVLVGQPELDEILDSNQLRQLKQRIALRAELGSLDIDETSEYITRRLKIAGAPEQGDPIFPADAIAAVHRYSQGLPRLINTICENGLITAYAINSRIVTPDVIEEVARQFRLDMDLATGGREDFGIHRETDIRRAASALGDLFLNLLKSAENNLGEPIPFTDESRQHEPSI
jgi:general secretion pathway protein A